MSDDDSTKPECDHKTYLPGLSLQYECLECSPDPTVPDGLSRALQNGHIGIVAMHGDDGGDTGEDGGENDENDDGNDVWIFYTVGLALRGYPELAFGIENGAPPELGVQMLQSAAAIVEEQQWKPEPGSVMVGPGGVHVHFTEADTDDMFEFAHRFSPFELQMLFIELCYENHDAPQAKVWWGEHP